MIKKDQEREKEGLKAIKICLGRCCLSCTRRFEGDKKNAKKENNEKSKEG